MNTFLVSYLACSIVTTGLYLAIAKTKTPIEAILFWLLSPIGLPVLLIYELPNFIRQREGDRP